MAAYERRADNQTIQVPVRSLVVLRDSLTRVHLAATHGAQLAQQFQDEARIYSTAMSVLDRIMQDHLR